MAIVEDPVSRIESLIEFQAKQFRRAFEDAVRYVRDSKTLEQIADLLASGRFEEAVAAVDVAGASLGNAYGAALSDSAQKTAAWMNTALNTFVTFDQTNTRAVRRMQENQLRLIREFSQDQRNMLRSVMSDGVRRGLNPNDQAVLFRQSIGLTYNQQRHVENYRRQLESIGRTGGATLSDLTSRALHDTGNNARLATAMRDAKPLTQKQIDAMVDKYRQNYIAYRSRVIARTEALRSVHEATEEMYLQAIESGGLESDKLERKWVTARDERVRSTHGVLNGQKRPIGEPWTTANGRIYHPGDPKAPAAETVQCRCVLTTTFKT